MATEKLTPLAIKNLKKPGYHGDGGGLWLQISPTGAKSWVFRYMLNGKAREMGLGSLLARPLADARGKAGEYRQQLADGIDPLEKRKAERMADDLKAARAKTFDECCKDYIAAHEAGWKNGKHAAQWRATLDTYASPVVGKLEVAMVDTALVMKVLEPIWKEKTETASRLRGRIESVLGWATVRGFRQGDNPARWKGHLANLLPAPSKVAIVKHHAALDFHEVGAFVQELKQQQGMGARALEFAILTAARSGEVRGATWAEINLDEAVWTVPEARMKAGKEHRVPLSSAAVNLLRALPRTDDNGLVFPAPRGGMLSDMTLTAVLRRMGRSDITAHGFRSAFRDWAGETTAYPREVIEHALAHQLRDKAEAAYARGTLFEKRRRLMAVWARHCGTVQSTASVTAIRA